MMVDATRHGGTRNWAAGQEHGAMAAVYCVQLFCILQLFFKLLGAKMFAKYFRHLSPNCS